MSRKLIRPILHKVYDHVSVSATKKNILILHLLFLPFSAQWKCVEWVWIMSVHHELCKILIFLFNSIYSSVVSQWNRISTTIGPKQQYFWLFVQGTISQHGPCIVNQFHLSRHWLGIEIHRSRHGNNRRCRFG